METKAPLKRMHRFAKRLELTDDHLRALDPYRETFASRKDDYADYFHGYMMAQPETRRFLELERRPKLLWHNWQKWFERLFAWGLTEEFMLFLWHSGIRHVQMGVDQRYINLGYSVARLYCERMVREHVPEPERPDVSLAVNKLLDFCLLVATDALVSQTTHCDREVMNGIAHQVRNPLSVIGGYLSSLRRKADPSDPVAEVYDTMYQEANRLERMVADVGTYIQLHEAQPMLERVELDELLQEAAGILPNGYSPELHLDAEHPAVLVDRSQLLALFREVLKNAWEAADPDGPRIAITTTARKNNHFLRVDVFNNGQVIPEEVRGSAGTPFYSSKAMGTGFGLAIVNLVVRKIQGSVDLEPVPHEGTVCHLKLPLANNQPPAD